MKSSMTTERIIEQTEKQIQELEKWNKVLWEVGESKGNFAKQAAQVRENIMSIHELSKFLCTFNGKPL